MEAIASTLKPLWRSKNGFNVKNMGNHIVLFIFDSKLEVDTILENEPWSFDKHLMVLQRYDKDTPVEELQFNHTTFWVQVHDIPVRFMNQKVADGICSNVRMVIKKSETEGEGGSFMRVWVRLDITIPLSHGRKVSLGQGKELWVSYKYECLSNICYWCGCLNHDDRDYEAWIESEGSLKDEDKQFGPWLRATPVSQAQKTVVIVPGFYKKTKGASSIPKSPIPSRKAQVHSMAVQPHHEEPSAVKKFQTDSSTVQSMESVTEGQNKCSPDFQQPHDYVESLENEITAKGINRELNEARNDTPSFFNPDLIPPQKETSPNNISINLEQQESFLSKLAEIDEGLSKLSALFAPNYEGPRKAHSSHVTNEEV